MRKVILILILAMITIVGLSQNPFKGFWKPIDRSIFQVEYTIDRELKVDETTSFWLFRPFVSLTAMQFTFANPIEVSSLSSLGTGISYSHFINQNNAPYNNFGINALILFTDQLGGVSPAKLSFAITGSFLQYISIGGGYSFANKKFFILTGIAYNFN